MALIKLLLFVTLKSSWPSLSIGTTPQVQNQGMLEGSGRKLGNIDEGDKGLKSCSKIAGDVRQNLQEK